MKPGDLIRIHRHNEYGSEQRKRFQPCFVGSLDQDSLLEPLRSFRPAIVNRCKGAQGLKLSISLGKDPDELVGGPASDRRLFQIKLGGRRDLTGNRRTANHHRWDDCQQKPVWSVFAKAPRVGNRHGLKSFSPDAGFFPGCA